MAAALSLFVILTAFIFITRLAAIALRMTGMPERVARFQCLSALSGAGFTTSESEMIVNYPIRRRIISMLIIMGNVGFLSLSATFVVSLLSTDGQPTAIMEQIVWLGGGMVAVWLFMLNPFADRLLCSLMGRLLAATTHLGQRRYLRTLQVSNGLSVAEHHHHISGITRIAELPVADSGLLVLALLRADGTTLNRPSGDTDITSHDRLVLYGSDDAHEHFEDALELLDGEAESRDAALIHERMF